MSDKAEEKISYQKTLSALFASFSMLCFGALSLLNNFAMDYYSVMFMVSIVIPASLSMGFIGFVLGKIFDEGENFGKAAKIKNRPKTPEDPYKIESMFGPSAPVINEPSSMFEEEELSKNDEPET